MKKCCKHLWIKKKLNFNHEVLDYLKVVRKYII